MTEVTANGIVKWTNADPSSLVQESQTQGDSIELALSKRERYDFVWANSAERTAQTGMVQGSRGYQVDTKSEYLYDSSAWRLALSHAEFTASMTVADITVTMVGVFSVDAAKSTDTTFITPGVSGALTFVQPGIYAVSTVTELRTLADSGVQPVTGRTFLDLSYTAGLADIQRVSINTQEDRGSLSSPNVRSTIANQNIWFQVFKATGGNCLVKTRARITRIG